LADKNAIANPTWLLDGFDHTRHNIGKCTARYHFNNKCRKDCKCNFMLDFPRLMGKLIIITPYDWEGKQNFASEVV
jgi:hypothetical protein